MKVKLNSLRANLTEVELGEFSIVFSYEEPIAFYTHEGGWTVSENIWSPTTGKHLNEMDGGSKEAKAKRLPHEGFTMKLAQETQKLQRKS